MDLKKEILEILTPRFGHDIIEFIGKYYEPDNENELIEMAQDLLVHKVGEKKANELLKPIIEKNKNQ